MNYSNTYPRERASSMSEGVRKTLFNTFVSVGAMMAITAVVGAASLSLQLGLGAVLGLFAASLVLIFAINYARNSPFGLVLLAAFSGLQGVSMGPVLNHYLNMQGGSGIVASAAGLTALAAFGCAVYAIQSKRDFSRWRGFLFASTLVLLVAMLAAIFIPIPALHIALSAATAVLFTAWLMFDIGAILNGQETNYVSAALSIYLDLLNIFMSLLRLLGVMSSDD